MAPITTAFLEELVADTNQLLHSVGLPLMLSPQAPIDAAARRPELEEAHSDFLLEARQLFQEAAKAIDELASELEPGHSRNESLDELGSIFHRMKGSALVVGEDAVAAVAASLEVQCSDEAAPTIAELSQGLARIAVMLGLGATPARGGADEADVRRHFLEEARRLCNEAEALTNQLPGADEALALELQGKLGALLHRLKGSAAIVPEPAVAKQAAALHDLCAAGTSVLADKASLLQGFESSSRTGWPHTSSGESMSLSGQKDVEVHGPRREAVEISADPELQQAFMQECSETLDALDKTVLELEESSTPKNQLRTLFRHYHTLKGVVNTIGLGPTGKLLHCVEDFVETLIGAEILPAMRSVASFLLDVQVEIRKNLKQARKGYVETSQARFEARAARILSDRHHASSSRGNESRDSVGTPSSLAASSSVRGAPLSEGSRGDATERRFIRVSTERLDTLMNLAGELVVNQSRLTNRVNLLRDLQSDLVRGSRRLLETVETFRDEHEFANLDGRKSALGHGKASAAALSLLRPTDDVAPQAPNAGWGGFSELELDRYEGVHILSRTLAELTGDFNEMYGQLSRGLAS